jgi:coenzyme F420-reducing hydrogenase alpha subunit
MKDLSLSVHHVTRVEGHANITVDVRKGEIKELKLEIVESPRFFEAMLRGRSWEDVAHITSRICGICAVGHTAASLRATEAAFDFVPSEQTVLLRKLIIDGETMQSHLLHVYFLVAPDLLGVGSVIPLAATHPEVVKRALRLKKLANDICGVVGGRAVHPISMVVGGFTRIPTAQELGGLRLRLVEAMPDLEATAELIKALPLPRFENPTEYLALKNQAEYAFYDGDIASTDGDVTPVKDYRQKIRETVVEHSTTKHVSGNRQSLMVGALARFNNNHEQLHPLAKKVARELGLRSPCHNSFMISVAQVVETVHAAEDAIMVIDELLGRGLKDEPIEVPVKAGSGVGAVEVPRGTLYHEYRYDSKGVITDSNLIIPTGQNMANIEFDLRAILPQILDRPKEEIAHTLEMVVRAYDPCISCSTHLLDVRFV